jgi:hypothetical protein
LAGSERHPLSPLHPNPRPLKFAPNSGILAMQTNLSVRV